MWDCTRFCILVIQLGKRGVVPGNREETDVPGPIPFVPFFGVGWVEQGREVHTAWEEGMGDSSIRTRTPESNLFPVLCGVIPVDSVFTWAVRLDTQRKDLFRPNFGMMQTPEGGRFA